MFELGRVEEASSDVRELRSGSPPWHVDQAPFPRTPILADTRCDVVVVGAGITGSFVAEALTRRGHSVVVVDKLMPGRGSTAASTAMLQWEIDTSLSELSDMYGFEKAAGLYRRSFTAMTDLTAFVDALGASCHFTPRSTLYLGSADTGLAGLSAEHALRERAGLPGALLDRGALADTFRMIRPAALLSPGSAEADPLCLSLNLLRTALLHGAVLVEDEVVAYDWTEGSAALTLASGPTIEAGHVVLATGYEMPDFLRSDNHRTVSSWCIATCPQSPGALWHDRVLIWEAATPYLYARTTDEGRIVLGGEDDDTQDAAEREAATPAKVARLLSKMRELWPAARYDVEYSWSAQFGETDDGLPLIGRVPGAPRMLAAYGYGGNGITYSFMASRILSALVEGEDRAWFGDYAIDRTTP
ncbi:NAD(P)/FAD-dependent oxidoreductase [Microvirga pudoricolor]|uniref:NAD(P)/FAD-dependent oxidoreductase n=1 Tax=Microvirga pudoricolor TaxID=2778729 RepID=UPI0019524010|nr:FAD-dependent oxidoreductase [Microvirga pudoricolor]MBM6592701.1 FAD-dependent oxidoreductase [Microvirga pudoricolor]